MEIVNRWAGNPRILQSLGQDLHTQKENLVRKQEYAYIYMILREECVLYKWHVLQSKKKVEIAVKENRLSKSRVE